MAPAVPFALLGVVQLAAVAVWLGFAAASCFPGLVRRTTPIVVIASLAMAAADALTALHLDVGTSDGIGLLRVIALLLLLLGLADGAPQRPTVLPAITAPLGARTSIAVAGGAIGLVAALAAVARGLRPGADRKVGAWIGGGLALTAVAAGLAGPSGHSTNYALAQLSARGVACVALTIAIALIARASLLGKVVGAIVAGVTAMAVGAVAVVGIGVASEVQHDQSGRLLSVAQAQQKALEALQTHAGLLAQVISVSCPGSNCGAALKVFSEDPSYFAAIDQPNRGIQLIAPNKDALTNTALVVLAGSKVVRTVLHESTANPSIAAGPVLLPGAPARLAIVAAFPGVTSAGAVKPNFAAIYGIGIVDQYLSVLRTEIGYDVSVIANNFVLASSLNTPDRLQVLTEARANNIDDEGPDAYEVVPANGTAPTVAFVSVTEAGNDNQRIATLAISQPASAALAAQRSVLRRLVLTALAVLVAVALFAFLMAQRIAEPVRRLTIAAGRVRAGDLDTSVTVDSADEVGELARAFGAMTESLRSLTGDLRDSAEQEARLRARLETVVSSMTDGLVTTDSRGVVVAANPMALELLGRRESEIIGSPLGDVVDVRGADGAALLPRSGVPSVVDGFLSRAENDPLAVRVARAPLADQPGEVVVISDRTREREIERLKTEFLSNVSHELRTPLTPIRGYAEMLSRRPDLPRERVQTFVAEILAGTARMSRAVELLVDVAALDAGRVSPQRDEISVEQLVDDRLTAWRARYPDRAGDLRRRVAAKLPAIEVDPGWLGKALDELADNAVKYTASGTSITLAASLTDDGAVSIAVRDAGEGIDTERLAELLGDFSQADSSDTRKVGGMGLGLGFVTRVADALGLTLEVTSEPGRGSEFAIEVPATPRS